MPRTPARLLCVSLPVAVALLAGSPHSYARGVHFGVAGPCGSIHQGVLHQGVPRAGFLNRHIFFKGSVASSAMFVLDDDPYAIYPPDPCYVVLP